MHLVSRFIKNESGATAIEYALIAAVIGLGLIASVGTLRDSITSAFGNIGSRLNTQSATAAQ